LAAIDKKRILLSLNLIKMGLRYLLALVFLLSLSSCKGQLPPKQYSDALVVNNEIWGLTTDGKIRTFNLNDGSPLIKETHDLHSIVAFAKDNKSNIVIADSSNRIQIIDQNTLRLQYPFSVYLYAYVPDHS
jgi:hypothetical protein